VVREGNFCHSFDYIEVNLLDGFLCFVNFSENSVGLMRNQKRGNRQRVVSFVVVGLVLLTLYVNYTILVDEEQQQQLIFDIGLSTDAIEKYLMSGHKVVGVSANPLIVIAAQELFQAQIMQSKLVLINAGIEQHDHDSGGRTLFFYVHRTRKEWSSFSPSQGCKKEDDEGFDLSLCAIRKVETTSCSNLIKTYGVPHYVRIHADGKDWICLESIEDMQKRPKYISIEAMEIEWLEKLKILGYEKFKVVQHDTPGAYPYGESAQDFKQASRWRTYDEVRKDWPYFTLGGLAAWHWHAAF